MGNRLRAELGHHAPGKPPRHPLPTPEAQNMSVAPEAPLGQLQPHSAAQRQHRISTVTCRSTRHKENRSPKPRPAQEFHRESGHRTRSSSSAASGPLQDTWKLLDLGSSPSGLTSQDDSAPVEFTARPAADSLGHPDRSPVGTRAAFAIEGMKMEAQAKAKPTRPSRAHPAKTKGCQRPPKIRNYNLKD
ncbi:coiled-coil domain-containing protein 57-like [Mirounga leonina]|nr:coiled-coil domain-containing protein 57-like [Mirounga leonina]